MNPCHMCSDLGPRDWWNEPLFESANFVVLASVGALVEGWLLLLPKDHFICMGALPGSLMPEMAHLKDRACSFLRDVYGKVSAFEHGPHRESLSVGCGVDHAHLHLVPIAIDLRCAADPFLPSDIVWNRAGLDDCRRTFVSSRDYLYLEQPIGGGFIAIHDDLGSQLFRRAIAAEFGIPREYNWREFPQFSKVEATIARAVRWRTNRYSPQSRVKAVA